MFIFLWCHFSWQSTNFGTGSKSRFFVIWFHSDEKDEKVVACFAVCCFVVEYFIHFLYQNKSIKIDFPINFILLVVLIYYKYFIQIYNLFMHPFCFRMPKPLDNRSGSKEADRTNLIFQNIYNNLIHVPNSQKKEKNYLN